MNQQNSVWQKLKERTLSTHAVRRIDQVAVDRFQMNSLVLMENAALNSVHWLTQEFSAPKKTLILCGRGNNGGDGLAICRHLQALGWPCQVLLYGPTCRLSADSLSNYRILQGDQPSGDSRGDLTVHLDNERSQPNQSLFDECELIVDAMLGTGATGEPRSPFDHWIISANRSPAFRLAIDVPTGVDAQTAQLAATSFQPHATLTFVARKPAMSLTDCASVFGRIEVLPIGIPTALMQQILDNATGEFD